jgi:hypothetical protein
MANRILIGNRATGGHGIYVSQSGENVLNTTNALQFDSRMGASVIVQSFGQGTVAANTSGTAYADFTHNLGYNPLFAVRWNLSTHLSSGVATKVYTPATASAEYQEQEEEEEGNDGSAEFGVSVVHASTSAIRIFNRYDVDGTFQLGLPSRPTIYYAIVVFHQADFTGGKGL